MANDIRLLQHDRQLEEPFEENQIGSSAMPYKRNPMRSERICSLSRFLISDAVNASMTASVQWLERTLDDSANRRISMPEGFLCADAILRLCRNVPHGLVVNEVIIGKAVREHLPFIATENLLMEAVKRGGNRQELHEVIRRCSHAASAMMEEGEPCDLLGQLAALIIYQEPTEPPGGSIALRPVALFLRFDTLLLFPTAQNVTISLPAKRDSHCPHLVKRSASSFARAVRSSSVT